MTTLEEIKTAVASLSKEDYSRFRQWFLDRDWAQWDREMDADVKSGKLDFLIQETKKKKDR